MAVALQGIGQPPARRGAWTDPSGVGGENEGGGDALREHQQLGYVVTTVSDRAFLLALSLTAAVLSPVAPAAFAQPAAVQSASVEIRRGEWRDEARGGRIVPYKLYVPKGAGPFPTIVHSHGLGGSREASTYILQAVAEAGFLLVSLQHAGSDSALLSGMAGGETARGAAGARGMTAEVAQARYGDVPFAIDQLARETSGSGPMRGKADLSRLGMSGHSYGALSTLVAVGQRVPGARGRSFAEPRIKAAIAYSPNKPRNDDAKAAFAAVRTPMLHFTGTEDTSPFDLERSAFERTTPYQTIGGADQFLIILNGGDHAVFGGRRAVSGQLKPTDPAHMALIQAETIRFWRAYLAGDRQAAGALCSLPQRVSALATGYVKAVRCGPPTPIAPLASH
ncbi:alpha/beta hydrolase family protein [Phenylobacterium sp.]|uniref:alpha/beta hydrolase family protein n=1 Tax=Phenylobacterium sp. TaxID=1871053 RepID=UPI0039833A4C